MSEHPPPRVTVTLSDGRTAEGRHHGWRQGADGHWRGAVTIEVPAGPSDGDGDDTTKHEYRGDTASDTPST